MPEWDWIRNSTRRLRVPIFSGMTSSTSISPYDAPEALRASVSPDDPSLLIIEFRYATTEPITYRQAGQVTLGIGKNSSRLYEIQYKVPQEIKPGEKIRFALGDASNAIDLLVQDGSLAKRKQNYGLAKDILSSRADELDESMLPESGRPKAG